MTRVIAFHEAREFLVVFREVRSRTGDTHISEEHIYELRDFIDTGSSEKVSERKNSLIALPGLPRALFLGLLAIVHRAEFDDVEGMLGKS